MAFIDWRSNFSVNDPNMDAHHQRLFEIINRLHKETLEYRGRIDLGELIGQLLEYVHRHFAAEEQLMEVCGYPNHAEHKEAHERIFARVVEMDQSFRDPNNENWRAVPEAFAFLLKEWLMEHILIMDKAYAPYVLNHNQALEG